MCLAIPMQVVQVSEWSVRCTAKGVEREASLLMVQGESIEVGDYVVVSLGHVTEKIDPASAQAAWALYDQILTVSGPKAG
jgi:hydrogenase expression/formation protein HypC